VSLALLLRIVLGSAIVLVFAGSLVVILVTGPVVVRAPAIDLGGLRASRERLRADVERLCSEFTPRSYLDTEALDRAADWLAAELGTAGFEVALQAYPVDGRVYQNVVARRRGSDPSKGVVVIGAHYDAYREFPGADDNASGVAVLLELARTLPQAQATRDRYLVAFSTEEPPYFGSDSMGSYVFAKSLLDQGRGVERMLALDMVGYFSDLPRSQSLPARVLRPLYPDRGDFIAVVGDIRSGRSISRTKRGIIATGAIPVHSFRAPAALVPPVLWSDHLSFRKLGFPAAQITDTAFMRYTRYHTPADTPDQLDYERMARLVEALHGVLWESESGD
jgi:hypothetical protein